MLLACLPLLGGAALFEHYALSRQRLQLNVDLAAAHGAHALGNRGSVEARARGKLAEARVVRPGDLVEIENPPRAGRFRGWKQAVRVRVRQRWSPPLLPRSIADTVPLDVVATAISVPPGPGHPRPSVLRAE